MVLAELPDIWSDWANQAKQSTLDPERQAFVQQNGPYARRYGAQTGIAPEVLLAMKASETNWGKAGSTYGIKGKGPSGMSEMLDTWEAGPNGERIPTRAEFATYANEDEANQHLIDVLNQPNFRPALDYVKQSGDSAGFLHMINQAGYATDPNWANSIVGIANSLSGTPIPDSPMAPTAHLDTSGTIKPPGTEPTSAIQNMARLVVNKRISAEESRQAVVDEEARARLETELGTPMPALPHEDISPPSTGSAGLMPSALLAGSNGGSAGNADVTDGNAGDVPYAVGQNDPAVLQANSQSRLQGIANGVGGNVAGQVKDWATSDVPYADKAKSAVETAFDTSIPGTKGAAKLADLNPYFGALNMVNRGVNVGHSIAGLAGLDTPTGGQVIASQVPTTPFAIAQTAPPGELIKGAGMLRRAVTGVEDAGAAVKGAEGVLGIVGKNDRQINDAFKRSIQIGEDAKQAVLAAGGSMQEARQAGMKAVREAQSAEGAVQDAAMATDRAVASDPYTNTGKRLNATASELSDRMGNAVMGEGGSAPSLDAIQTGSPFEGTFYRGESDFAHVWRDGVTPDRGRFFTPDRNTALGYAGTGGGSRLTTERLTFDNPLVIDSAGGSREAAANALEIKLGAGSILDHDAKIAGAARAKGYDAVVYPKQGEIQDLGAVGRGSALSREADALDAAARNRPSEGSTIGDIAIAAKRLGDPASEIRRQLQQGGGEPDTVNAMAARTPEENARLKAERTAGATEPIARAMEEQLSLENAVRTSGPLSGTAEGSQQVKEALAAEEFQRSQNVVSERVQQAAQHDTAGFPGTGEAIKAEGKSGAQAGFGFAPPPGPTESAAHRAYREVVSLINAPISLVTYGHEPVFRQGIGFALSHPTTAREAIGNLVTTALHPEAAQAINDGLNARPFVKAAMDLGWLHEGDRPAETVVNKVLNAIPGMKNSRESARIYLTTLRKAGYEDEAARLAKSGVTDPAEFKALWDTVSDVTGHGLRGQSLSVGGINPVFSPQALLGRFRGLIDPIAPDLANVKAGGNIVSGTGARNVAVKNLLAIGGLALAVDGIAKAAGADLKWDLLDTPLGKVSVGSSTVDPTAGYNSIFRLGARTFDAAQSGDMGRVRDAVSGFVNGQLGPVSGTLLATFLGHDWQGKDFNLIKQVLADPTQKGSLARQLIVPIAANSLIDGIQAHGLAGAALASPSLGAMSVETNLIQDARDKAAERLSGGKVTTYEEAKSQPLLRQQVENDPAVIAAKGSRSESQQFTVDQHAPIKAEVDRQETLFKQNQNTTKLRDVYHDATQRNIQAAVDFSLQYGDQLSKLSQTEQQKALREYYAIDPKIPDGQPDAGGGDFERQASERLDYLKAHPEYSDFIKQSLQVAENNKTPLHQNYDSYIAAKKQAGYFDIKPDDQKATEKRAALDRANPALDVASWYFGSTAAAPGAGLNSMAAVDLALKTYADRPVVLAGYSRPLNQTPAVRQIFDGTRSVIQNYEDAIASPVNLDNAAANIQRGAKFSDLTPQKQSEAKSSVSRDLQATHPDLDATLAFFGRSESLASQRAKEILDTMIAHSGIKDASKDKQLAKITLVAR